MNGIQNMRRPANGIIFAPGYWEYSTTTDIPSGSNLHLWDARNPNWLKSFTKDGIQITENRCFTEADGMPATPKEGYRGFYPVDSVKEWRTLPLPLQCSTWFTLSGKYQVEAVIFDAWFSNYNISAHVEVHPSHVFKALFTSYANNKEQGTQLYSVVAVRWTDGTKSWAKWYQDSMTGAFAITTIAGDMLGMQGGYRGHLPMNCYRTGNPDQPWAMDSNRHNENEICHWS